MEWKSRRPRARRRGAPDWSDGSNKAKRGVANAADHRSRREAGASGRGHHRRHGAGLCRGGAGRCRQQAPDPLQGAAGPRFRRLHGQHHSRRRTELRGGGAPLRLHGGPGADGRRSQAHGLPVPRAPELGFRAAVQPGDRRAPGHHPRLQPLFHTGRRYHRRGHPFAVPGRQSRGGAVRLGQRSRAEPGRHLRGAGRAAKCPRVQCHAPAPGTVRHGDDRQARHPGAPGGQCQGRGGGRGHRHVRHQRQRAGV